MIFSLLWLIPVLPLIGFVVLVLGGYRLSRTGVALIGVGLVGVSALIALLLGGAFILAPPPGHVYAQTLWTWFSVDSFAPRVTLYLDPLSVVMMLVVTVVGFLIHLYSAGFMEDDGYSRFFAYMNLFVGSMLVLVLADNLLTLYLGWEGVGLCSYLLIGFWYKDPNNGRAAMKAFIVTRIGDAALAVALFLLFTNLGTLQIQDVLSRAAALWVPGSALAIAAAALILGGAVGKSAQLPLQTWLPDAMAGPTPVSALIHAATMVTAGVYLIARTHVLFTLAPPVLSLTAIIGTVTLLLAGFSALVQSDIKRVLAYSTISQIGYMFLALGVGAWSAAIFHFVTHAFFKALLFLAAGVVIINLHEEHDMFKMGGLRKKMPLVFWTFLIGALSLSALPLVTAGFYSKDLILYNAWTSANGSPWLWAGGFIGAFLTALYAIRMVLLTFFGNEQQAPAGIRRPSLTIPLVVLAVFSIIAGFIELPRTLGNVHWLSNFLLPTLPLPQIVHGSAHTEFVLRTDAELASLAGIFVAYLLYRRRSAVMARDLSQPQADAALLRYWYDGWGLDRLYDTLFVRPYRWFARVNKNDFIDLFYSGLAWVSVQLNCGLSALQNGKVRWYATAIAVGAVVLILILVYP